MHQTRARGINDHKVIYMSLEYHNYYRYTSLDIITLTQFKSKYLTDKSSLNLPMTYSLKKNSLNTKIPLLSSQVPLKAMLFIS